MAGSANSIAHASTAAVLAVYSGGGRAQARVGQFAALAVYGPPSSPYLDVGQLAALMVYNSVPSRRMRADQLSALISREAGIYARPKTSQFLAIIVYGVGIPVVTRTRSWTFSLDGHTFYVLDLGATGTWLYDTVTQQWCRFSTQGYLPAGADDPIWNMRNGAQWGQMRIVGGDSITGIVWELDPLVVDDEGFRDLVHVVSGGVVTRSRVYQSLAALRLSASVGLIDDAKGATINMRYSDDEGQTWSDYFPIPLTAGDIGAELAWRSLGSFCAPGRLFEISDVGGIVRIDGCDAFIDNFDDASNQQNSQQVAKQ